MGASWFSPDGEVKAIEGNHVDSSFSRVEFERLWDRRGAFAQRPPFHGAPPPPDTIRVDTKLCQAISEWATTRGYQLSAARVKEEYFGLELSRKSLIDVVFHLCGDMRVDLTASLDYQVNGKPPWARLMTGNDASGVHVPPMFVSPFQSQLFAQDFAVFASQHRLLTRVDLHQNYLRLNAVIHAISENLRFLQYLDVGSNEFAEGLPFALVLERCPLKHLDLRSNRIMELGERFMHAATASQTLEFLSVSRNDLKNVCDYQLSTIVRNNGHLKSLNISLNRQLGGANQVLEAMQVNTSIEKLVAYTIGKPSAGILKDMLCMNKTLYHLDLSRCEIGTSSHQLVDALAEGLKANVALNALWLNGQGIPPNKIFEALKVNDTLGILAIEGAPPNKYMKWIDNTTLYSLSPIPNESVREQLAINLLSSNRARDAVVLMMAMRMYHPDDSGYLLLLPRDILIYLCKWVWKSRRSREWRGAAGN